MDNLAEGRDRLWQETRTNTDPAVSRLGKGWPKGLPIQYLVPNTRWAHCALQPKSAAPYLRSRLEDILKAPFHDTLTPRPDVRPRNEWADSLCIAIESYVGIGEEGSEEESEENLLNLFQYYNSEPANYASESQQHLEQLQVFRQWLRSLAETLKVPKAAAVLDRDQDTRTPTTTFLDRAARSHDIFVWDSRCEYSEGEADEELTNIPVTLLYCHRGSTVKPSKPFLECQEAVILSSILFLHSNEDRQRLVSSPFPNEGSIRYPPVSLDDRFVTYASDCSIDAWERATQALRKLIKAVPARLLRDMAMSLLDDAADISPKSDDHDITLLNVTDAIVLFGLSDRPELAADVVNRVIQHLPDASSYHRHMRLIGPGKRLQPGRTKDFVGQFAKFVMQRLEQNQRQDNQSASDQNEIAS
ncbi:hypothetical protein BDV36DRAFT_301361 [Aspergillus pseudocaelatus]|uniref:Uncharacterized protein n=1 Tax=Aspergillus pseudocaelatus TaxID=1825620 RepID=A0ABQ6W974_9EURO|nr:hypothetical protein BDV36DRAFT_301361 [Aspergillus pseudocaelatus]